MLASIELLVRRASRALALGASACLLALALLTMADILLRWLFKAPIRGLVDLVALATAIIAAAYFPALIAQRGNITIRLLGALGGRTLTRALDAFGALVTAAFFALMTWQYVRYSAELTRANEATATLRWPTGPWWWVVTAMFAVTTLVALVVLARDLLRAGTMPVNPTEDPIQHPTEAPHRTPPAGDPWTR